MLCHDPQVPIPHMLWRGESALGILPASVKLYHDCRLLSVPPLLILAMQNLKVQSKEQSSQRHGHSTVQSLVK